MAGKTIMKLSEIKPAVKWDPAKARNLLITLGAGIKKKADGAHHNIGAVKCSDKGDGKIEVEWTGTLTKLEVEEIARY